MTDVRFTLSPRDQKVWKSLIASIGTLEAPATAPFEGVIGVEGMLTGDGRLIEESSLGWASFPLPLRWASADFGGHDGAVIVGRIDRVERRDNGDIYAWGELDLGSKEGREVMRLMRGQFLSGVSMDLDSVTAEEADVTMATEDGDKKTAAAFVTSDARIRAATLVAIPAFDEARLSLIASLSDGSTEARYVVGHGAFNLAFASVEEETNVFDFASKAAWRSARDNRRAVLAARTELAAKAAAFSPRARQMRELASKVETLTGHKPAVLAPVTATFGYNALQWRSPRDGQWIDMPGISIGKLLDYLRSDAAMTPQLNKQLRELQRSASEIDDAMDDKDIAGAQAKASEAVGQIDAILNAIPDALDGEQYRDTLDVLDQIQEADSFDQGDTAEVDEGDLEGSDFEFPADMEPTSAELDAIEANPEVIDPDLLPKLTEADRDTALEASGQAQAVADLIDQGIGVWQPDEVGGWGLVDPASPHDSPMLEVTATGEVIPSAADVGAALEKSPTTGPVEITTVTADEFDALVASGLTPGGIYKVTDTGPDWGEKDFWAYSPDGKSWKPYDTEKGALLQAEKDTLDSADEEPVMELEPDTGLSDYEKDNVLNGTNVTVGEDQMLQDAGYYPDPDDPNIYYGDDGLSRITATSLDSVVRDVATDETLETIAESAAYPSVADALNGMNAMPAEGVGAPAVADDSEAVRDPGVWPETAEVPEGWMVDSPQLDGSDPSISDALGNSVFYSPEDDAYYLSGESADFPTAAEAVTALEAGADAGLPSGNVKLLDDNGNPIPAAPEPEGGWPSGNVTLNDPATAEADVEVLPEPANAAAQITPEDQEIMGASGAAPGVSVIRDEWDPAANDGVTFDEAYFDAGAIEAEARDRIATQGKITDLAEIDAAVQRWLVGARKFWEDKGRTEPAKSYETGVPIRLIPTGTQLQLRESIYGSPKQSHRVGTPINNGDINGSGVDDIVGKYWDGYQWDYVGPSTQFDLGYVDPTKKLDKKWQAANERAAAISKARSTAAKLVAKPPAPTADLSVDNPVDGATDTPGDSDAVNPLAIEDAAANIGDLSRGNIPDDSLEAYDEMMDLIGELADAGSDMGLRNDARNAIEAIIGNSAGDYLSPSERSDLEALFEALRTGPKFAASALVTLASRVRKNARTLAVKKPEDEKDEKEGMPPFALAAEAAVDEEDCGCDELTTQGVADFSAHERIEEPDYEEFANWVEQTGGLPRYIKRIAKHLQERGMTESHAIASAVNTVKRWARGGGNVKPDTIAKALAALAEWEAKKAAAHATAAVGVETFAATATAEPEIIQDIDSVASAMLSVSNDLREEAGLIPAGTRAADGHYLVSDLETLRELTEELAKTARSTVTQTSLVASGGALLAPVAPPKAWFDNPELQGVTPITVTKEGRIYGHLATWDACHMESKSLGTTCTRAPRSNNGYAGFHLGYVTTAEGVDIPTGRIVAGAPHADPVWGLNPTLVHYSHSGWVGADVRVGEDRYGIWVSGALRPDITASQLRALKAQPLSGDWREDPRTGRLELVTALAVTAPGFQVPRPLALVASMGNVQTLQAVGLVAPKTVVKPGTPGALSNVDLGYLKERADAGRSWAEVAEAFATFSREAAEARVTAFARRRTMEALSSRIKEMR